MHPYQNVLDLSVCLCYQALFTQVIIEFLQKYFTAYRKIFKDQIASTVVCICLSDFKEKNILEAFVIFIFAGDMDKRQEENLSQCLMKEEQTWFLQFKAVGKDLEKWLSS